MEQKKISKYVEKALIFYFEKLGVGYFDGWHKVKSLF